MYVSYDNYLLSIPSLRITLSSKKSSMCSRERVKKLKKKLKRIDKNLSFTENDRFDKEVKNIVEQLINLYKPQHYRVCLWFFYLT